METAQFGYDRNGFLTRCSHKYSRFVYCLSITAFSVVIGAVVVEKWRSEVGTTLTGGDENLTINSNRNDTIGAGQGRY